MSLAHYGDGVSTARIRVRVKDLSPKVAALDNSGLEAGRMSRRLSGWTPSRSHVNTLITQSGASTLARARFLVRNNGYAANAVECFASNLIGAGIVPSWLVDDADLKDAGQDLWVRWTDDADSEGVTDFYGLQRRIGRELFIAGECFVRLRPRYLSDGLSVPLQLQVLPSEMLPINQNLVWENGNFIRQGIEFDGIGRRVAYHFWKENPGDLTILPRFGEMTRVPADQVLHVYDPVEAGQIRGLSRLTPAIVSLWTLDSYDDAELERKKTAALFTAFITRPDPDGELFDKDAEAKAKAGDGIATVTLEAGAARVLMPGETVETAAPADVGPNYEAFQYRALVKACAGLGLPYAGVTGDLRGSNYATQRAGLIEARRRLEAIQHSVVVFLLNRPVWAAWQDQAVLAGAIKLNGYATDPQPYRSVRWISPRWEWVDPQKDRIAEVIAVNAGFKARSQVIEAEGYDAAEIDERIAEDDARAKSLGLTFIGTGSAKTLVSETPPEDASNPTPAEGEGGDPAQTPAPAPAPAPKPKPKRSKKG